MGVADAAAHIEAVTAALASFGESARNAIDESDEFGDIDTSDLFTEVSRGIDYQLWLVESRDSLGPTPSPRRPGRGKGERAAGDKTRNGRIMEYTAFSNGSWVNCGARDAIASLPISNAGPGISRERCTIAATAVAR